VRGTYQEKHPAVATTNRHPERSEEPVLRRRLGRRSKEYPREAHRAAGATCRGRLPAEPAWRARSERLAPLLVLRTRPSEPLMPALGGLKGDHQGRPYIRPCGQRLRRGNPSSGDFVTSSGQALRFALDDGVCWVAGARSRSPSPQAMVDAAKMPHAPPMARNRDPRPGTSGEGGRSAAGKHGPRDPSGRRTSGTEAGHARRQSPLRC
jgi:hypothetical protein